jgi:hypothetical protein
VYDFLALPAPIGLAFLVGLLFPAFLLVTRPIAPIAGNASLRYAAGCLLAAASWTALIVLLGLARTPGPEKLHLVNGALVLLSSFVVYLGLWGLLTRGCSISMLLALARLPTETDAQALDAAYANGRGLRWLTDKRINSLAGAGFASCDGDQVRVTRPRGALAAAFCTLIVRAIGLKNFG